MNLENLKKYKEQLAKDQEMLGIKKKKVDRTQIVAEANARYDKRHSPEKLKKEKEKNEVDKMFQIVEGTIEKPKEKEVIEEPEWDVPLGEPILWFDPNKSYELTGYRPITKDKGLDFDPTPFCEMSNIFRETGRYTTFVPKTAAYNKLWDREFDRCIHGMTVGKYHITGDNYFWLNYYQLLDSARSEQEVGAGRKRDFPIFVAKQYEYFHYMELCKKLRKDFCALKARAIGASEIACSLAARLYTTTPNTFQIFTASGDSQLAPTLQRCWQELDFLNGETQGGFRHLRQKQNTKDEKRASKVAKDGSESGWMSTIKGIISDDPGKLRGHRVEALYFEEAGLNTTLEASYIESESLTVVNGRKIGIRAVFGTGGSKGPQLAGLAKLFKKPDDYNILPYYNNYTQDGSYTLSGYFIPSYTIWFGDDDLKIKGMDSRGVTNEEEAKKYYLRKWNKMSDPQARIKDQAEHCFTPEQALILEGSNQFNQEKLTEQLARIEIHKEIPYPKRARLRWGLKDGVLDRDSKPTIEFVETGKIQIVETPMVDEQGNAFQNLYVAGIDSIDADATTSTGQDDVSKFAIVIMRRPVGLNPPKIVAMYKDRPRDVREAYDNAMKLLQYYNCKAVLESTRITIVTYFKEYHKDYLFMNRPRASIGTSVQGRRVNKRQIGVPATQAIIEHQLELIEYFINDYCEGIEFPELLNELIRYSFENKRKFDLVAAMGMMLMGDEDMYGKAPNVHARTKKLRDIGYYRDEYGYLKYGVIPSQEEIEKKAQFVGYDWIGE